MKKQLKKLNFSKETISTLEVKKISGGKGPQTFLAEGCGTSVAHSACVCHPVSYFDDSCGSCQY